jgi:hypothetical protein
MFLYGVQEILTAFSKNGFSVPFQPYFVPDFHCPAFLKAKLCLLLTQKLLNCQG